MTSRESLRNTNSSVKPVRKHWITTFLGIIAFVVLLAALLLNTTVLNEHFALKELSQTTLNSQIKDQINDSFNAYGMTGEVVDQKQTDELLKTAIKQVYAGKPIHLDVSDVVGNLQDSNSLLQGYQLPGTISDGIDDTVNEVINNSINSSQLTTVEQYLKHGRRLVIISLTISILVLLVIAIYDLFTGTILRDFRWICLVSTLIFWGGISFAQSAIASQLTNDTTWGPIVNSIVKAVYHQGEYFVIAMLILSVFLFVFSIIRRHNT